MARSDNPADHKPSIEVINGVAYLLRTSPSQIKTFQVSQAPEAACERKWWYDKRAQQVRKPDGKGVKLGKECHGREEHFLLTGQDVRGKIELAGAHLLEPFLPFAPSQFLSQAEVALGLSGLDPAHTKARQDKAREIAPLKVEQSIGDLKTPEGVQLIGFSDFILGPGYLDLDLKPLSIPAPQPLSRLTSQTYYAVGHVGDHKFKKDLKKYAETAKQLETDAQAVIYSAAVLKFWPETTHVRFAHHNHQTERTPDAYAVPVVFTRDQILAKFGVLCDLIDGPMQEAARINSDRAVKANRSACGAFGGCDFEKICPDSPKNRFLVQIPGVTRPGITLTVEGKNPMGLVDEMQAALKAQANGGSPAPAQAAPSTPAPAQAAPAAQAGGHSAAADFIAAGMGQIGHLYFAQNQIGMLKGSMGDSVIFVNSAGTMFQVKAMDPIKAAGNDPVALAAFGLAPAAPAAPATVVPPAEAPRTGMPIFENGVQVAGTPIPGAPQGVAAPVQGAGAAINPPVGATSAANPEIKAAMELALKTQQATALGQTAPAAPAVANVVNTAPAATGTPPEEKRKPGRPKGPRKAAEGVATGATQAASLAGLILVVDAAVSGEVDMDLAGYVSDLHEIVCAAGGCADVRLADPKGPLGYGAWRGAMAAAALKSPPSGICTIARGDLADPVIEALSSVATLTIRG